MFSAWIANSPDSGIGFSTVLWVSVVIVSHPQHVSTGVLAGWHDNRLERGGVKVGPQARRHWPPTRR
jgi:hypothetical protein